MSDKKWSAMEEIRPSYYERKRDAGGRTLNCLETMGLVTFPFKGIAAFCVGNVVKYLWRFMEKGDPAENLRKARTYLKITRNLIEEDRLCYAEYTSPPGSPLSSTELRNLLLPEEKKRDEGYRKVMSWLALSLTNICFIRDTDTILYYLRHAEDYVLDLICLIEEERK